LYSQKVNEICKRIVKTEASDPSIVQERLDAMRKRKVNDGTGMEKNDDGG